MLGDAKLKMLQELLSQMQGLMAEGQGDDASAGQETMEGLEEGADEAVAAADEEPSVSESASDDEDLDAERKAYFQRSGKLSPKKATMMMGAARPKAPMQPPSMEPKKSKKFG